MKTQPTIPVFYTPLMVADSRSTSPSAAKPKAVVASWAAKFPIEVIAPEPVTRAQLALAHDPAFVESILAGKLANGFGNTSAEVAAALPYTSGAMLAAARHVLAKGGAAAAPCSGFHHAGYRKAEGFCTFNGLMVTALVLHAEGVERVGILDLDMHYGNGTDDIRHRTDSMGWVKHFTAGRTYVFPEQAESLLRAALPEALASMRGCDLVLYQAGADPHIDDPHGGLMTTEQLRRRDALVFDTLATMGVPVAWNLAGGYQVERDGSIPKVLAIHDNTMRECVRVYGAERDAASHAEVLCSSSRAMLPRRGPRRSTCARPSTRHSSGSPRACASRRRRSWAGS